MAGDNRRSGFSGVLQDLEEESPMRERVSPRQPSVGLRANRRIRKQDHKRSFRQFRSGLSGYLDYLPKVRS